MPGRPAVSSGARTVSSSLAGSSTRRLALLLPPARERVVDERLLELCDATSAATEWVRLTELLVLDAAVGSSAIVSAASSGKRAATSARAAGVICSIRCVHAATTESASVSKSANSVAGATPSSPASWLFCFLGGRTSIPPHQSPSRQRELPVTTRVTDIDCACRVASFARGWRSFPAALPGRAWPAEKRS